MLKYLTPKCIFLSMSQKSISAYFKKEPQGTKRKQNDHDDKISDSPKNFKKSKEECIENCDTQNTSEIRSHIIALSKLNPALSANIGLTWFKALSKEFDQKYFKELGEFLKKERSKYTIYPPEKEVYFWTNTVKIHDVKIIILGQDPYHGPNQAHGKKVKVIILGQDPYHGPNQAHGLAFSVRKGVTCPPSLKNMYKELAKDIPGFTAPSHGFLYGWASQGVLLLNATLTVRAGCPNSHKDAKWNHLTDAVIRWIDQNLPNSVFMLWGKNAQEKMSLITKDKHLILVAPHPSPFSADRGFFGCRHFSKANEYLKKHNKKAIDWNYLP